MTYEVKPISDRASVTVAAKSEWSAVAKAHVAIHGGRATSKDVTWHGMHAECRGFRYAKPVVVGV